MIYDEDETKSLTVGHLVSVLQTYDPNMKVILEGCDCEGYLGGIRQTNVDGKPVAYLDRTP